MAAALPIGSKRVSHGGYVEVKTGARPSTWEFEHRVVWQAGHGAIPPGQFVHHLNGDKQDNRLANLHLCASNAEHHRTFHKGRKLALTEEERQRRRDHMAAMNKGQIASKNRGKPKSPEHREKLRAALAGRTLTSEQAARRDEGTRRVAANLSSEERERRRRLAEAMRDPVSGRLTKR